MNFKIAGKKWRRGGSRQADVSFAVQGEGRITWISPEFCDCNLQPMLGRGYIYM